MQELGSSSENEVPRVFISYTHDSSAHSRLVLNLSNALRAYGFDSRIDQYFANQSWPIWMEEQIDRADYVLIVCTEVYYRRWHNDESPGKGLGAQWESLLTRQSLYESPNCKNKFIPVFFGQTDVRYIPKPLRDITRISLGEDLENFKQLQSRLLNIAPAEMPPIRTSLSPISLSPKFFEESFSKVPAAETGVLSANEKILTNLLKVIYPTNIQASEILLKGGLTVERRIEKAWKKLGNTEHMPLNYCIDRRKFYCFESFDPNILSELIKGKAISPPRPFPSKEWAESKIFGEQNKFIKLLNKNLTHLCVTNETQFEIVYSKEMGCHLFAVKEGVDEGTVKTHALKSSGKRNVYKPIYNYKDPATLQHWQHVAFRHKFERFSNQWYLVITPFWAFTSNGKTKASRWQKKSSANKRKPEKNRAVLGHVAFWSSILCREVDLLTDGNAFRLSRPEELEVNPSIQDSSWMRIADEDEKEGFDAEQETLRL